VPFTIRPTKALPFAAALVLLLSLLLITSTPGRAAAAAPATPDIEMLTSQPKVGDPVTFVLSSSPDTEVFLYGWHGVATEPIPAMDGEATLTVIPPGSGRHTLYVAAMSSTGDRSPLVSHSFVVSQPLEVGRWQLSGDGSDSGEDGGNDLELPQDPEWGEGPSGQPASALMLDGTQCASTSVPVVDTARSFTVSAWVRLTETGQDQTVISQAGGARSAFQLAYREALNTWVFEVVDHDDADHAEVATAVSIETATVEKWTHLVGVADIRDGEVRVYVNGILRGEAPLTFDLWSSSGMHVGCAGAAGDGDSRLIGALHDVRVFDGEVSAERAGAISSTMTGYWHLEASGQDYYGGNDLTFYGEHEWVRDRANGRDAAYRPQYGSGYARTSGPTLRTDESFSLDFWTTVYGGDSLQTLVAQTGDLRSAVKVVYRGDTGRFEMIMASADTANPVYHKAVSQTVAEVEEWYHIAAVFDAVTGQMRLYVNGQLEATGVGPVQPWQADGSIFVSAVGNAGGVAGHYANATLDDITMYQGILSDRDIANRAAS